MSASTLLLILSLCAYACGIVFAHTDSGRWVVVSLASYLCLTIAALVVSGQERAEGPGKVCVVQKREPGGDWTCDEWRKP